MTTSKIKRINIMSRLFTKTKDFIHSQCFLVNVLSTTTEKESKQRHPKNTHIVPNAPILAPYIFTH